MKNLRLVSKSEFLGYTLGDSMVRTLVYQVAVITSFIQPILMRTQYREVISRLYTYINRALDLTKLLFPLSCNTPSVRWQGIIYNSINRVAVSQAATSPKNSMFKLKAFLEQRESSLCSVMFSLNQWRNTWRITYDSYEYEHSPKYDKETLPVYGLPRRLKIRPTRFELSFLSTYEI